MLQSACSARILLCVLCWQTNHRQMPADLVLSGLSVCEVHAEMMLPFVVLPDVSRL